MQPNTLSIALFYHSLGLNIIPWRHGNKGGSVLKEWYRYQVEKVTIDDIHNWFSTDDVGIAILTGHISGITVIDDDLRDGSQRFNSTCIAMTGGGGYHYFYKYQPNLKSTVSTEKKVDILNDGKLVFVYPTIHKSGKRYTWLTGMESLKDLPPVPLDSLLLSDSQTKDTEKHEKSARLYEIGYDEYLAQGQGSRDSKLKDFCLEMWRKGMSRAQVLSLAKIVNKTYAPPLEDSVVEQKVDSTFRALGYKQDYTIQAVKPTEKPSPLLSYKGAVLEVAFQRKMVACGEGISTGFADIDPYFKLYPQHLYMVTAGTHIGKTTFAMSIAAKVASSGKRVTMFALEDGLFAVPKIKKALGYIPESFTLVDCDTFPTPSQIMGYMSENEADFVVIDHIHFLSSDDKKESMKDTIIDIAKNLKLLTKTLNIPIMSLVHIRKQDKSKDVPPLIDDMKDAQELGGLANVVCILHRKRLEAGENGYFDTIGTLNIAKAKVPNGKLGTLSFSIENERFETSPYKAILSSIVGEGV